jgi:hypothetical protein
VSACLEDTDCWILIGSWLLRKQLAATVQVMPFPVVSGVDRATFLDFVYCTAYMEAMATGLVYTKDAEDLSVQSSVEGV